jgi:hypothetical protein
MFILLAVIRKAKKFISNLKELNFIENQKLKLFCTTMSEIILFFLFISMIAEIQTMLA